MKVLSGVTFTFNISGAFNNLPTQKMIMFTTIIQTCFRWQVLAPKCDWEISLMTEDRRTLQGTTVGTRQSIPKAHKH